MTLLESLRKETSVSAGEASALPFGAYSDPGIYELEIERIFQQDWLALCPASSLPAAGDYLAVRIGGEPLVVMRGKDGELRALSNVCRHRGTLLLDEGFGNADRFLCPYHAWSYDQTGALRSVPYPGDIEIVKGDHGLHRYRLEEWAGVIFVTFSPRAPHLSERLAGLNEHLAHYELERYRFSARPEGLRTWKTNWKLALENGMESYHLFKVHRETLETLTPTAAAYYMTGSAPWSLTAGTYAQPGKRVGDEPAGIRDELEMNNYVLVSIPPTLVGILTPDSWGFISVLPTGPEECVVTGGASYPRQPKVRSSRSADFFEAFMEEDRVICERNQLAMSTRRARGGRMIQLERILVDFHQYLGQRLFDQEPDPLWRSPDCWLPAEP
ncbi:MAG: aromatic ring-hydroxylating dioxygenase subunit alpha [Acidobacteriota bacterium]